MTDRTPNDTEFHDLARRYMAETHDLELPTPEHHWEFEPSHGYCSFGTCEWDTLSAYSVGPDGSREWEGIIPEDEFEPLTLATLLTALVEIDARQ